VIVVKGGRIVEDGTPADLIERRGSYYKTMLEAETMVREGLWSSATWRRLWLERGRLSENNGGGET
jgi:ABC-type bacteriocin/lantibiotic exporters, contain an N-terminal double-glycine peptidase domain